MKRKNKRREKKICIVIATPKHAAPGGLDADRCKELKEDEAV